MCGICGEFCLDKTPVEEQTIAKMMAKLERRGPDSGGMHLEGYVGFGHRRLSIIDLSARSNQPMVDAALGYVLVFNGTIYNYRELRATLSAKGYTFFSEGDTEVIIKAYHFWGEQCVEHFKGMFAFAIWDKEKQHLFLARDRFGIKPLYYSYDGKCFRFASNVQALLAAGCADTTIDSVALQYQFTLHGVVPAPHTIFRGIKKLVPATTMLVQQDRSIVHKTYWQLKAQRPVTALSEQEWIAAIREALCESIKRRRLASDVPVGVLLSGGLDSSLLVGLLAESGQENLLTFSVGFEDVGHERGSEFEYSDLVADKFQTDHHKIQVPNDQVLNRLPEAVAQMAEPMFSQDAVAFYLLAEQVSKKAKVVMSGQGADEVFAGYFWYPQMHQATGEPLERFSQFYFDRDFDEYKAMVTPDYVGADYSSNLMKFMLTRPDADEYLDQVLRADTTMLIVDDPVKRVDNMTMAWGLESRVPFLDHDLVELAAQMPVELKLKEGGKYPLKAISRGLLPDAVIDRKKGYFPMPALKYVRGDFLSFMRDILNSKACIERNIFQRDYVNILLDNPESHMTRIQGSKLWQLAAFEFWLQTNLN